MAQVIIILGSRSDQKIVENSELFKILDKVGVSWTVSVFSVHRNDIERLKKHCIIKSVNGAKVFIGIAGMAAALPGIIASLSAVTPVIGVPLPSKYKPDAEDALYSMIQMPKGRPVAVCGIGENGLYNAAIFACQIVAVSNKMVWLNLKQYISETEESFLPEFDLCSSGESLKKEEKK